MNSDGKRVLGQAPNKQDDAAGRGERCVEVKGDNLGGNAASTGSSRRVGAPRGRHSREAPESSGGTDGFESPTRTRVQMYDSEQLQMKLAVAFAAAILILVVLGLGVVTLLILNGRPTAGIVEYFEFVAIPLVTAAISFAAGYMVRGRNMSTG